MLTRSKFFLQWQFDLIEESTFLGYFVDETVGARYGTLLPSALFFLLVNNTIMQRGSA